MKCCLPLLTSTILLALVGSISSSPVVATAPVVGLFAEDISKLNSFLPKAKQIDSAAFHTSIEQTWVHKILPSFVQISPYEKGFKILKKQLTKTLQDAAYSGDLATVKNLVTLTKNGLVDVSASQENAFRGAVTEQHYDIAKFLLEGESKFPNEPNKWVKQPQLAFTSSTWTGNVKLMKLIYNTGKVDQDTAFDAATSAAVNGKTGPLKFLIETAKVDPSGQNNQLIRLAVFNGRPAAVKMLVADPRVDPATADNSPLKYATMKGYYRTVNRNIASISVLTIIIKPLCRLPFCLGLVKWIRKKQC